jgi:hypothetical protein
MAGFERETAGFERETAGFERETAGFERETLVLNVKRRLAIREKSQRRITACTVIPM